MIRTATLSILALAIRLHLLGVELGVKIAGRKASAASARVALQNDIVTEEVDRLEFFVDDAAVAQAEFHTVAALADQEHARMRLLKRPPPPPGATPQVIDKRNHA